MKIRFMIYIFDYYHYYPNIENKKTILIRQYNPYAKWMSSHITKLNQFNCIHLTADIQDSLNGNTNKEYKKK